MRYAGCEYENEELYLAVGLYEGYATLLQWSQAKGYSHLEQNEGDQVKHESPCCPALCTGDYLPGPAKPTCRASQTSSTSSTLTTNSRHIWEQK